MKSRYISRRTLPTLPVWERVEARRTPASMELELTPRCNNNCRHCYINRPAGDAVARERELPAAFWLELADQATALGTLWCSLTGGEPLLRDDFETLYLGLRQRGLLVSLLTNACLVTNTHIRLFRRHPPRDIEATVYGATEAVYERVTRQPGSYAAFRRGLERLRRAGLRVHLKTMALRSNYEALPDIWRFCAAHTCNIYRFDPFLNLRYDGDARRNAEIRAERLTPDEIIALERADAPRQTALTAHCRNLRAGDFTQADDARLFFCTAGQETFGVSWEGQFLVCPALRAPGCVYDLRRGSLADAWRQFTPTVLNRESDRPEYARSCRRCALNNLCQWCPAHAHLETGRLDDRPPCFCNTAHARAAALLDRTQPPSPAAGKI